MEFSLKVGDIMATSIQFMRGLKAKVDAANIKDGQPALVRRGTASPLLYVGSGSGVGKAVQLAPDVDIYGNTSMVPPETGTFDVGSASKRIRYGYFNSVNASGTITGGSITVADYIVPARDKPISMVDNIYKSFERHNCFV